jgi:hypothetical protein
MTDAAKTASQTSALRFRTADLGDVDGLVSLINSAFRVERLLSKEIESTPSVSAPIWQKANSSLPRIPLVWPVVSTLNFAATMATWVCLVWIRRAREPAWAAN